MSKNKPKGFWKNVKNVRQYFCQYAQEMGFDPTVPENWDHVSVKQMVDKKVWLPPCHFS